MSFCGKALRDLILNLGFAFAFAFAFAFGFALAIGSFIPMTRRLLLLLLLRLLLVLRLGLRRAIRQANRSPCGGSFIPVLQPKCLRVIANCDYYQLRLLPAATITNCRGPDQNYYYYHHHYYCYCD